MRAILVGLAIAAAGCLVSRRSPDLECSATTDCTGGRTCNGGYCVLDGCPAGCTSCDTAAKTCAITCTAAGACSNVTCPTGYSCDIAGATGAACGAITCSTGRCTITCAGANACGAIDCASACACDVTCVGSGCGAESCPARGGACTSGGNCDSAARPPCDSC